MAYVIESESLLALETSLLIQTERPVVVFQCLPFLSRRLVDCSNVAEYDRYSRLTSHRAK